MRITQKVAVSEAIARLENAEYSIENARICQDLIDILWALKTNWNEQKFSESEMYSMADSLRKVMKVFNTDDPTDEIYKNVLSSLLKFLDNV